MRNPIPIIYKPFGEKGRSEDKLWRICDEERSGPKLDLLFFKIFN